MQNTALKAYKFLVKTRFAGLFVLHRAYTAVCLVLSVFQ